MDDLIHFSSNSDTYYEDLGLYNEYIEALSSPKKSSVPNSSKPEPLTSEQTSLPLTLSLRINDISKQSLSKKLNLHLSSKPKRLLIKESSQLKSVHYLTQELKEEINAYTQENPSLSQAKVARHFRVNRKTFSNWVQKNKIHWHQPKRNKTILTEELAEKINAYTEKNPRFTQKKVAKHFKIKQSTFSTWIQRNKIDWHGPKRKKTFLTEELTEKINAYIKKNPNLPQKKVAKHFNIKRTTISTWIREGKIEWYRRRKKLNILPQELTEKIDSYIEENPNFSRIEVAEYFNLTSSPS